MFSRLMVHCCSTRCLFIEHLSSRVLLSVDAILDPTVPASTPEQAGLVDVQAGGPDSLATDFYGQEVSVLKMFGDTQWGEVTPGKVTGDRGYQVTGVVVDRSLQPNAIYVVDRGNSRILGFRSFESPDADLVFGQPDKFSGAPNGDANLGIYAKPSSASLALLATPSGTNLAEQWLKLNIDVDAEGNLYVPDAYNNRVLVYYAPFSPDKTGGKGDTVADLVIGQNDFTSNGVNRGNGYSTRDARSLSIGLGYLDGGSSRGVSVDAAGNVWVADTYNSRVLRFPKGQTTADLVLGQKGFTSNAPLVGDMNAAPLDRMYAPTLARVDPETGDLYVIDEYPADFPARIMVFSAPFNNGMAASRLFTVKQPLAGDYAQGYRMNYATGLVFNPVKTDDWIDPATQTARYRDGYVWITAGHGDGRVMLLDRDGNILLAVDAPDTTTYGSQWGLYHQPDKPYYVGWPGGMIGFDDQNNIYLADGYWQRVGRFALPYRPQRSATDAYLPNSNGGLLGPMGSNSVGPAQMAADNVGVVAFGDQLIVHDNQRYLVWNDYLSKPGGAPADLFIGQSDGDSLDQRNHILGRSMHAVDDLNRMWATGEHGKLMVYQLPMTSGELPLRELVPFYWADDPETEVSYFCGQAVAFEPATGHLWVADGSRLLRVRLPDDINGKLLVDAVIGQTDKTSNLPNRGMDHPDAASFETISDIKFDPSGNMFVVDNHYEGGVNARVIAFMAADMIAIDTMFPAIQAKKVYVSDRLDQTVWQRTLSWQEQPFSPVSIAFNSRGEMVIGNDGYYRDARARNVSQLFLYRNPLSDPTPDATIKVPMGAPGEMTFDANNDLIVQDHTYNRVWVINYDRDPSWLTPIGDGLYGTYWPSVDFSGTPVTQIDRQLYIGSASPWPVTGSTDVSIRWTGKIVPRYSETYTFLIEHDDGARLWINNQLVVDGWSNAEWTYGSIALQAGVAYDLKAELRSWNGGYFVLHWESPSQVSEVVPQTRLFSGKARPLFGLLGDLNGDGVVDAADRAIMQSGEAAQASRAVYYGDGDLNEDQVINAQDYALIDAAITAGQAPHLSISDVTQTEGSGGTAYFDFTVSASRAINQPIIVNYATAPSTASEYADFTPASGLLTLPANQISAVIRVAVAGDLLAEDNESFFVDLSNASGAWLKQATGVGTIIDDDTPPQPVVSAASLTMPEGQSRQITVRLSAQPSSDVAVDIVRTSGDASLSASIPSILFTPLDWDVPRTVLISAAHDYDTTDAQTTFNILVTAPKLPGTAPVTLTATAIDDGRAYARGNGLAATYFDNSDFTGTAVSRVDPIVDFSWYSFGPDPAIANDAFSARWTGWIVPKYSETYTFYAKNNDGVRLWVNGDPLIDNWQTRGFGDSAGTITLIAGQAYAIRMEYFNQSGSALVTLEWTSASQKREVIPQSRLYEVNPLSAPMLSIADASVMESNSGTVDAIFMVTLTEPSSQTVTVHYSTSDGTAQAGFDYVATSGDLMFLPGETSKTFAVPVIGDTLVELDETFWVNLSNAVNATIGLGQGQGTIVTDELPPGSSASPGSVYTFSGVPGSQMLAIAAGTVTFPGDVFPYIASLSLQVATGATVVFNSTQHLGSLDLNGGSAIVGLGAGHVLEVADLTITKPGSLDLGGGSLILDHASSPITQVQQWIGNGRMGATPALKTSGIVASGTPALAMVDNALLHLASFAGQSLGGVFSQLLIQQTVAGDANLDGVVNDSDYLAVIANMGRTGAQWFLGDLNGDGVVTVDDLTEVSAHLGNSVLGASMSLPLVVAKPKAQPAAIAKTVAKAPVKAAKPVVQPKKPAPHHKRAKVIHPVISTNGEALWFHDVRHHLNHSRRVSRVRAGRLS